MASKVIKSVGNVCFRCGKVIRGKMTYVVPPLYLVRLGDFERAYHPKCYAESENEAAKELGRYPTSKKQ